MPSLSSALPPDAALALVAERLVDQARSDGVALTGEGGLLTGLVQQGVAGALEAEITDHLGYEAQLQWTRLGPINTAPAHVNVVAAGTAVALLDLDEARRRLEGASHSPPEYKRF